MTQYGVPYKARDPFKAFHLRDLKVQRWACIVAHRRAGKTVAAVNELVRRAADCKRPEPRYAYIAPYTSQAKDVAWSYLRRCVSKLHHPPVSTSELWVELPNGARIRLYGADNYDRLRGLYLDGVVLDEYAAMDPRAGSVVIGPALADRLGGAAFIGTPKGRNAFFELYERAEASPDWYALRLWASQTGLIAPGELDALRAELSPDEYAR